ncbi:MAG: hypothetical protein ACF8TS_17285 [Maioricimonas sp. JB049]
MSTNTQNHREDRSRAAKPHSNLLPGMVVILLLAIPLLWLGIHGYLQHKRIERLRDMHARFNAEPRRMARVHNALMATLGPRAAMPFRDVVSLVIERQPVSVDDARWLQEFPELTALHLLDVGLTDDHLEPISEMTHLRALALRGPSITDRGFARLGRLTNLRQIMLRESELTGASYRHLAGLPNLTTLTIEGGRLGKDGIGNLAALPALHRLELHYAPGRTVDLEHLHRLPTLTSLTLEADTLPPGIIDDIARVRTLRGLTLIGPEVTDEDLRTLQSLPDLKRLAMYDVVVSQAAVDAFRQARPDCRLEGKRRRVRTESGSAADSERSTAPR